MGKRNWCMYNNEEIVLRWLINILKSDLMTVNRAPKARAKIHVYINMTDVWTKMFTRIWIRPKNYLRQFGEGVSILLRQMDITIAIGEMRRLMCIPVQYFIKCQRQHNILKCWNLAGNLSNGFNDKNNSNTLKITIFMEFYQLTLQSSNFLSTRTRL